MLTRRTAHTIARQLHHEAIQSNVLALPNKLAAEILAEIFEYVAVKVVNTYPLDPRSATWAFRQVCSKWREIALQSSAWNTVVVGPTKDYPDGDLQDIKFWVRNLAHPTRTLSFQIARNCSPSDETIYKMILKPYHARIHNLTMNGQLVLMEMPEGSFPSLKSLTLEWPHGVFREAFDLYREAPCFVGMTSLRSFQIHFGTIPLRYPQQALPTTIPWNLLSSMTLSSKGGVVRISSREALQVLQQCSLLEYLSLSVTIQAEAGATPITMPCLTSLAVASSPSIFDLLVAPSLATLSIQIPKVDAIIGFVRRSQCALHSLTITMHPNVHNVSSLTPDTLKHFDALQALKASKLLFSADAVQQISNGVLLPNIESISLAVQGLDEVGLLAQFVLRRAQYTDDGKVVMVPLSRLRNIDVWVSGKVTDREASDITEILGRVRNCGTVMMVRNSLVTFSTQESSAKDGTNI